MMDEEVKGFWGWLRAMFPPNRVVALLTPFAATLAGVIAAWVADHAPLIAEQVDATELTAIFVAIAGTVVAMAYKWLEGWTKYEQDARLAEMPTLTPAQWTPLGEPDAELDLSLPDDISPDDVDDPAVAEPKKKRK